MLNTYNLTGGFKTNLLYPILAFVGFVLVFALGINYLPQASIWEGWTLGPAGLFEEFCERNRMDCLIREPANTWSNLAYVFYGFLCIAFAINDRRVGKTYNWVIQKPVLSVVYGLSLIYLGFSSFFYHASLTRYAQRWDMAGTYALLAFPLVLLLFMHVYKPFSKTIPTKAILGVIVLADILLYVFKWQLVGVYILPLMIVLVMVGFLLLDKRFELEMSRLTGLVAVLIVLVAFAIWYLDVQKILCWPDSFFQGHALWHVLTGLSGFMLYLLLRTIGRVEYADEVVVYE